MKANYLMCKISFFFSHSLDETNGRCWLHLCNSKVRKPIQLYRRMTEKKCTPCRRLQKCVRSPALNVTFATLQLSQKKRHKQINREKSRTTTNDKQSGESGKKIAASGDERLNRISISRKRCAQIV